MPLMEDSGIESEDKSPLSNEKDENQQKTFMENSNHMEDIKVIFSHEAPMKYTNKFHNTCTKDYENVNLTYQHIKSPPNTCRILQRKLELKVERAKRNYSQYQEELNSKRRTQSASLIPINRLPIPGIEQNLLVDYNNESDDLEEISFFPKEDESKQRRCKKYAELTDTFSIQEMTLEDSDIESDNESENLELLTPRLRKSLIDYISNCFCFQRTLLN